MKKIFMTSILFTIFCFTSVYADNKQVNEAENNYHMKVYLDSQSIEIFQNGKLLKKIPCSTGLKPGSTLTGKFKTYARKDKDTWTEENGADLSYYFITRFNESNAFHSMIEGNHPLVEEGKKLFAEKKPSSMGCVRLKKEDAKWIYSLPLGIPVEVIGASDDSKR